MREVLAFLLRLGEEVADRVLRVLRERRSEELSRISAQGFSDVLFVLDQEVETLIVERMNAAAADVGGIRLIAEGIGERDQAVFPMGMDSQAARWLVLMDPIDGTRGLMYNKRSAFFLAGLADNAKDPRRLRDLDAALMVELPTTRMAVADRLWAIRGGGVQGETRNLVGGGRVAFTPRPTGEGSIENGFVQFSRFFHPGKDALAALEEALMCELFPDQSDHRAICYEDQYISSGGQLYEMLTGKERLVVDLRAALYRARRAQGGGSGHTVHPYDLAAHLLGSEAGVVLTDASGAPLDAPLDTQSAVDWIGYANPAIQREIEVVLLRLVAESPNFAL